MAKFAIKKVSRPIKRLRRYITPKVTPIEVVEDKKVEVPKEVVATKKVDTQEEVSTKISTNKKTSDMETKDKIAYASAILANEPVDKVKKIKKEKGLIERTENSKIILTEDNKELLND